MPRSKSAFNSRLARASRFLLKAAVTVVAVFTLTVHWSVPLHPPPLHKGRRVRLRFMTQVKIRPPTFILSVSQPDGLGEDYMRYLMNRLREDFGLQGVPLRLTMRKPKNPFASRAKPQR